MQYSSVQYSTVLYSTVQYSTGRGAAHITNHFPLQVYGGVSYEGCTSDTYSWCALSTDSYGNYIDWAYCGYGNSNQDHCVFPFVYGGVEYNTCTDSWCATSAYENTKEYYSYKYCDADELALGLTTFDYGAGTTVTGEECVPMIYSGANYLKCTSDTGTVQYSSVQ